MWIYRSTSNGFVGTGSFWAEDPVIAQRLTAGFLVRTHKPKMRVLRLNRQDDLITSLIGLGLKADDAETLYLDSAWFQTTRALNALRTRYAWVRIRIEDTNDFEWVRLEDGPLVIERI